MAHKQPKTEIKSKKPQIYLGTVKKTKKKNARPNKNPK